MTPKETTLKVRKQSVKMIKLGTPLLSFNHKDAYHETEVKKGN